MHLRKDPLLCAAKLITISNDIALRFEGLATTGIVRATPGTVNTMAHTVTFTLDIRHVYDEQLALMAEECKKEFARIAAEESAKGCDLSWAELVDSPAVNFHDDCIQAVRESAADVLADLQAASPVELSRDMISGAGHDSCYTNRRCPTSMIFTPTKDGISHNPQEYCSPEDW